MVLGMFANKYIMIMKTINPEKVNLVDVEKWCYENGYYIGNYWFPYS
jgi:hypothetical protein